MYCFWTYLKNNLGAAVYLLLCGIICTAVFLLCRLSLAPVLYALGLCLFLGTFFLAAGYCRFWNRHRLLEGLLTEITVSVEHLPAPSGQLEADYQALLQKLFQANSVLTERSARTYQELLEYYTLWVHQIKTPIAAMQLILQGDDTPEYLELRSELFKIQQYVEMVLCYLRLDSTSTDFVFRPCDLDKVLRAAIRTYAGQFIRRGVRLVYEPVERTVLTDEKWLQFVLEQLLSNALKYTPGGTVTIMAKGESTLIIADTGIGIAPEDLPRIFEKGYTGLNGRGQQRSTGIGLYLCSRILKRLGHTISITSALRQGTEVRLELGGHPLEFD